MKTWSATLILIGIGVGLAISWIQGWLWSKEIHIEPRTVTDYLHAVIEADRSFYTQEVVERMESMLVVSSSEHWKEDHQLPLPAQFLLESAQGIEVPGRPIHYRLISLWPINSSNFPSSELDHQALEQVVEEGKVVENRVLKNGVPYFQAIYPDRAISRACVVCHNSHDKSPKRDFKLNDVMGGLEILIPLE